MTFELLLWCGVISGPLFAIVYIVEGYLREGYNPLRQPVSALSIGPRGWVQQANFYINGVLLVACAFGLHSILIGLYGAGLLGAGFFVTDVTGNSESTGARNTSGILHDVFSLIVFVSLGIACFVFAHLFGAADQEGWQIYSLVTGVVYFAGFLFFAKAFSQKAGMPASFGGLLQRLTISTGALWLSLVSMHVLGVL